jgi:high-affinity Fe2+/Pb2+ permease
MDALAEYEAAMAVYQQNMALWNSMSAEEQASAHANAENSTVGGYAGLVGLVGLVIAIKAADYQMKKLPVKSIFQVSRWLFSILAVYFLYTGIHELVEHGF